MVRASRRLQLVAKRMAEDAAFRAALAREADALMGLLADSVLAPYALEPAAAAAAIAALAPGRPVPLDDRKILNLIGKASSDKWEGPDGPNGDPPETPEKPPGGGCLEGSTLVATADGLRPAATIRVGDMVETPNGHRAVIEIRRFDRDGLVEIDTGTGTPIRCSREHSFHTADRGWADARSLTAGEGLTSESDPVALADAPLPLDGRFEVYDIVLAGERRFYVGEKRLMARKPHSDEAPTG